MTVFFTLLSIIILFIIFIDYKKTERFEDCPDYKLFINMVNRTKDYKGKLKFLTKKKEEINTLSSEANFNINDHYTECQQCEPGYYIHSSGCKKCSQGFYSDKINAYDCNECIKEEGEYPNKEQTSCIKFEQFYNYQKN